MCLKNKEYVLNIFFIEIKCSNFEINWLQKLNFLELSRKFLIAVRGHHGLSKYHHCSSLFLSWVIFWFLLDLLNQNFAPVSHITSQIFNCLLGVGHSFFAWLRSVLLPHFAHSSAGAFSVPKFGKWYSLCGWNVTLHKGFARISSEGPNT